MGYESRLYIISKREDSNLGLVVATMDMCKLDEGDFYDLFTYPIDFNVFNDGGELIEEDAYGDICSYAYLKDFLDWLEPFYKKEKRLHGKYGMYRRIRPLYKLLKSFDNPQWVDKEGDKYNIIVLHYGY